MRPMGHVKYAMENCSETIKVVIYIVSLFLMQGKRGKLYLIQQFLSMSQAE